MEKASRDFIPEESCLYFLFSNSFSSAKSKISSHFSTINGLEYPSKAPRRKIFSRRERSPSKPVPSSSSAEIFPSVTQPPFCGRIMPLMAFSSVDFPAPFVPIMARKSPLSKEKETFLTAQNSSTLKSPFNFRTTKSFRPMSRKSPTI